MFWTYLSLSVPPSTSPSPSPSSPPTLLPSMLGCFTISLIQLPLSLHSDVFQSLALQRASLSSLCLTYHPFFTFYFLTQVYLFLSTYNYIYFIAISFLHHNACRGPCLFCFLVLAHDTCSINIFERINK